MIAQWSAMENDAIWTAIVSVGLFLSLITMLAACLCCRKRIPKNDLLGLEGMVKIKNPDENMANGNSVVSVDPKAATADVDTDPKRTSNAPHRSLPDIPVSEPPGGDNGSELYATVGDKVVEQPQGRSPTSSQKKPASVSQHSSLSQADDITSPYARVRPPSHAYDKVRHAEHPYAQLQTASNGALHATIPEDGTSSNLASRRASNESLLASSGNLQEIPAASAIAGRISASQELPYMTPPIVPPPPPHFSGDSQDSSKGYTSISVREPLANILAQTNHPNKQQRQRDMNDSHYATVSDDSDEMYAAIEDSNKPCDLYTSGSETYAQIQPPVALTIEVEINVPQAPIKVEQEEEAPAPCPPLPAVLPNSSNPRHSILSHQEEQMPLSLPQPPPVDSLKAQMHSRQASSSSCTSSVGNLGSPKPEKRQANSPLPPTPKNLLNQHPSNSNIAASAAPPTNSTSSARNSIASIIEVHHPPAAVAAAATAAAAAIAAVAACTNSTPAASRESIISNRSSSEASATADDTTTKKKQSPSKDLEGMYAKVMKKNKFSNFPSENSSPILMRKANDFALDMSFVGDLKSHHIPELCKSSPDNAVAMQLTSDTKLSAKTNMQRNSDNNYETIRNHHMRHSSYTSRDPGYETIPATANRSETDKSSDKNNKDRLSAHSGVLAHGIQTVSQNTIKIFRNMEKYNAMGSSEAGYESLPDQNAASSDHGYEMVQQRSDNLKHTQSNSDYDPNYEVLKLNNQSCTDEEGYAKVGKSKLSDCENDGYSSISEKQKSIGEQRSPFVVNRTSGDLKNHDYASIYEAKKRHHTLNNNIEEEDQSSEIYTSIPHASQILPPDTITLANSTIAVINTDNYNSISINSSGLYNSPGGLSPETRHTTPSSDGGGGGSSTLSDSQITFRDQISLTNISPTASHPHDDSKRDSTSYYESLTGSESDTNYECVKYTSAHENPYERLHNEKTPDSTNTNLLNQQPQQQQQQQQQHLLPTPTSEVDDYFQV